MRENSEKISERINFFRKLGKENKEALKIRNADTQFLFKHTLIKLVKTLNLLLFYKILLIYANYYFNLVKGLHNSRGIVWEDDAFLLVFLH